MELKTALKSALKYNTVAIIPTLIGGGLVVLALYLILGQPVVELLDIVEENDLEWIMENDQEIIETVISSSSPVIGGLLIVIGYFIHRVGRTFMMFYIQGSAVVDRVENKFDIDEDNDKMDDSDDEKKDNDVNDDEKKDNESEG